MKNKAPEAAAAFDAEPISLTYTPAEVLKAVHKDIDDVCFKALAKDYKSVPEVAFVLGELSVELKNKVTETFNRMIRMR